MLINYQWYNIWRRNTVNLKGQVPEISASEFLTKGVSAITKSPATVDDFWKVTTTWTDGEIRNTSSRNILEEQGAMAVLNIPTGDYMRRVFIESLPPQDPKYTNLQDGKSVDMQIIRKPKANEYWFRFNANYYNHVTLPAQWETRQIVQQEGAISVYIAGIMAGLDAEWVDWCVAMGLETLYLGTHDANRPAQSTQSIPVPDMTGDFNQTAIVDFIRQVNRTITSMTKPGRTGQFNNWRFKQPQRKEDLVLFLRYGFIDDLSQIAATNAAPLQRLGLPEGIKIVEVPHFGGLIPYKTFDPETNTYTTQLYPVYSTGNADTGAVIGYAETEGATTATVDKDEVEWKDPHPETFALLQDYRALFRGIQVPRSLYYPPYNTTGQYQNVDDIAPHQMWGFDASYNNVRFDQQLAASSASAAQAKARAARL